MDQSSESALKEAQEHIVECEEGGRQQKCSCKLQGPAPKLSFRVPQMQPSADASGCKRMQADASGRKMELRTPCSDLG